MIAFVAAFSSPSGAPWRAILFVGAVYCYMKCLLIATNGEAAIKVVHDPTLVYWVQYPAKRPFAVCEVDPKSWTRGGREIKRAAPLAESGPVLCVAVGWVDR